MEKVLSGKTVLPSNFLQKFLDEPHRNRPAFPVVLSFVSSASARSLLPTCYDCGASPALCARLPRRRSRYRRALKSCFMSELSRLSFDALRNADFRLVELSSPGCVGSFLSNTRSMPRCLLPDLFSPLFIPQTKHSPLAQRYLSISLTDSRV